MVLIKKNLNNTRNLELDTLTVHEKLNLGDNTINGGAIEDNSLSGNKLQDSSIGGVKLNPQLTSNQIQALSELTYDKIMKLNPVSGNIVDTLTEDQVVCKKKYNGIEIENVNPILTFTGAGSSRIEMNSVNDDTINFKNAYQIKHSASTPPYLEFINLTNNSTFWRYSKLTNTFGLGVGAEVDLPHTILNISSDGRCVQLPSCTTDQQTTLMYNLGLNDKGCFIFNNQTNKLLFWDGSLFHQIAGTVGLGDSNYLDNEFDIAHSADETKKLNFDLSAIATGTTRTITMPNKNINLTNMVSTDEAQIITGLKEIRNNLVLENNKLLRLRNDDSVSFHSISYQTADGLEAICLSGSDSSILTSVSSGYFTNNNPVNAWNDKFSVRFSNNTNPKLFLNGSEIFTSHTTLGSGVIGSSLTSVGILDGLTVSDDINLQTNNLLNVGSINGVPFTNLITPDSTNTFTNKTISGSTNTISNIGDSSLSSGINANKISSGLVSNTVFDHLEGITGNIQQQLNGRVNTSTDQTINGVKTFQGSYTRFETATTNNYGFISIKNTAAPPNDAVSIEFENSTGSNRGIVKLNGTDTLAWYRSGAVEGHLNKDVDLVDNGVYKIGGVNIKDITETLTGKTISAAQNTISNLTFDTFGSALQTTINNKWTKNPELDGITKIKAGVNIIAFEDAFSDDMLEIRKNEIRMDGNKVLGVRQSAIADAVGSDEVSKINAILAVMRSHGFIDH